MSKTIIVNEIFSSVQGEGPNAGARCIFVRVQGCDYSCSFCDSKRTWGVNTSATAYQPDELLDNILNMCRSENCKHVVLTGGNPCLYDFTSIIVGLDIDNIKVDIETQGSIISDWMYLIDTIVFSPKPPSSNMLDTYDKIASYIEDADFEEQSIAIKIPVFDDEDIEFARKYGAFVNKFTCRNRTANLKLYLSVGNSDVNTTESIRDRVLSDYENLLNKINSNPKDFQNVFILPQLHTLVWGNKQGV